MWSIRGVLIDGLDLKIPDCLRIICECFLSSCAGLWCPSADDDLMRDAAAAPTDWVLLGMLSVTWCPRSIRSDLECLLAAGFWPELLSFPYRSTKHFKLIFTLHKSLAFDHVFYEIFSLVTQNTQTFEPFNRSSKERFIRHGFSVLFMEQANSQTPILICNIKMSKSSKPGRLNSENVFT